MLASIIFGFRCRPSLGLVYQWRLNASRESSLALQRELAHARLDSLARTLQPHFLFNALNSVTALVRLEENKRALTAIVALSDLLRIVLKTRGDVPGISAEDFQRVAEEAKKTCPVSKALAGVEIQLEAALEGATGQ